MTEPAPETEIAALKVRVAHLETALDAERSLAGAIEERLDAHEATIRKAQAWGRGALWTGAFILGLISQLEAIREFFRRFFIP